MQAFPAPNAPWPSPSRVSSVAWAKPLARLSAAAYGVAGSPVVPITRIGALPSARTVCGVSAVWNGQAAQDATAKSSAAVSLENIGACSFSFASTCWIRSGEGAGAAPSAQEIAVWASSWEL